MNYPNWVCHDCAIKAGGHYPKGHVSCWHEDKCDVCGETKSVTEPRDYCYPKFEVKKNQSRREDFKKY